MGSSQRNAYVDIYIHSYAYIHTFICTHTYIHTYIHTFICTHTYIHSYAHIHAYIHCKSSQQDQWLLRLLIAVVMADQGQMFVKETSFDNCTTGCDDSTIKSSHEKAAYGASSRLQIVMIPLSEDISWSVFHNSLSTGISPFQATLPSKLDAPGDKLHLPQIKSGTNIRNTPT
ncbi:unnamed protein product [Brassica napus]|uniref:(rape) hypothetical protein n=1 Tax=Brassica napus TaxID=3708 RepID=A0A816Y3H1_BRANA|nr:unnamed protein product [Brassica napus]